MAVYPQISTKRQGLLVGLIAILFVLPAATAHGHHHHHHHHHHDEDLEEGRPALRGQRGLGKPEWVNAGRKDFANDITLKDKNTGQEKGGHRCSAPDPDERAWAADEEFKAFKEEEKKKRKYMFDPTRRRLESPKIIPINFNVILDGGGEGDVSDLVIEAQIDVLNEDFSGTGYQFAPLAADGSVVNRTRSSRWYTGCYTYEDEMKTELADTTGTHLNFYICVPSTPSGGILGYASFPWMEQEDHPVHGVVVHRDSLPRMAIKNYNGGKTATHECGHWMGLYHTFEGGCKGRGDSVKDTAKEREPAEGCPTGRDTCRGRGVDPIENYMDYSYDSCMSEFTPDQIKRMQHMMKRYRPSIGSTL